MALNPFGAIARMFSGSVKTLGAGESATVDARGTFLTVITDAGTANISRVDSATASADVSGAQNNEAVAATTMVTVSGLEWPYYRITSTGGTLRYFSP